MKSFYFLFGKDRWYWALDENRKETGCVKKEPDPGIYSDIHWEYKAIEIFRLRWVSVLYVAGGVHPEWGAFHVADTPEKFPRKSGFKFLKVNFMEGFEDCHGMRDQKIKGQAVVLEL